VSKLTIPSEDALCLYEEEDVSGLAYVDKQFLNEWRWGCTYQLVIQDKLTEKYYSTIVQEQSGDRWYLSLEDFDSTVFDQVERIQVVTYEYRKPEDVER
jgi:hypothetical protein